MKTNLLKTSLKLSLGLTTAFALGLAGCSQSGNNDGDKSEMTDLADSTLLFQEKNITDFQLGGSKQIVLTYDDGPTVRVTSQLVDVLAEYGVKATFFVLAEKVGDMKETLAKVKAAGHIIANHSYSHAALSKKVYSNDINALLHEVVESSAKIKPFQDLAQPRYFRAPYGAWTASHAAKLNSLKSVSDVIGPVFWNIGGELTPNVTKNSSGLVVSGHRPRSKSEIKTAADWDCWGASSKNGYSALSVELCAEGYFKEIEAHGGGVVLMHDLNMKTVEMTKLLIPRLIEAGYTFTNLDALRTLEQYE